MNKYAGNPAVVYRNGYKDGHTAGVTDGFLAFSEAALLGAANVWEGDDAALAAFFRAWEAEVNRIFREECRSDPEYVQEALIYHTAEMRERLGIDG